MAELKALFSYTGVQKRSASVAKVGVTHEITLTSFSADPIVFKKE